MYVDLYEYNIMSTNRNIWVVQVMFTAGFGDGSIG